MKNAQMDDENRARAKATFNFDLVTDWLQIVTSLVVIAGLGLVIRELEQTRELTQAQLTSEGWARLSERNMAIVGEDGAAVLAKACDQPEALTSSEVRVMQAITDDRINDIRRIFALSVDSGLYTDYGTDWTRFSERTFERVFATEFGRRWWNLNRHRWAPQVVELGNRYLEKLGEPSCNNLTKELLEAG